MIARISTLMSRVLIRLTLKYITRFHQFRLAFFTFINNRVEAITTAICSLKGLVRVNYSVPLMLAEFRRGSIVIRLSNSSSDSLTPFFLAMKPAKDRQVLYGYPTA